MSIEEMIEYNKNTTIQGIVMPDLESFDRKVEMAISLWPQRNSVGGIDYLLGKGVGVELALRGEVAGREKRGESFPYRSHSDFEIYDCNGYPNIKESDNFVRVFGAQEWYPKDYTKGLKGIEEGYMDSTYDTVVYNGKEYLVPELELLFLDKYLRQESTPRKEGCDAILLMKQYKLDINKINQYFEKYVRKYELLNYEKSIGSSIDKTLNSINRIINYYLRENPSASIDEIEEFVNSEANRFYNINKNVVHFGLSVRLYPRPIKLIKNEDNSISVSEETKIMAQEIMTMDRINFENNLNSIINEINDCYNEIYNSEITM